MKKFVLLLVMICPTLWANNNFMQLDAMTFTAGGWGDDTMRRGARVAGRWDWDVNWLMNWPISVTGYWEAGFGSWSARSQRHGDNTHVYITSGSPIFQFWVGPVDLNRNALFFEFGIGPAYLSHDSLGKRDLGSNWHFEDKFGAGINIAGTERNMQLIYRYYHYSNASLVHPNEGLDLHTLALVWFFTP